MSQAISQLYAEKLRRFISDGYRFPSGISIEEQSQRKAINAYAEGIEAGYTKGYDRVPAPLDKAPGFAARVQAYLDATKGLPNPPRIMVAMPHDYEATEMAQAISYYVPEATNFMRIDDDSGKEVEWSHKQTGEHKPRIVLTTFKSLQRNRNNTVYPPNEFGLLLLAKSGIFAPEDVSRSVGKFTDAIQYAATDTPDRLAGRRMPHCYYQLSLNEAITQGDKGHK